MRVLHVVSSSGFAGIERHVVGLAAGLQQHGVESVIACRRAARRLRAEAWAAGIPVTDLERPVRAGIPHVVHAHDGVASVLAWPLATAVRARFVRTQHFIATASTGRSGWARSTSLALHRAIGRRVDATIAVSRGAATAALARCETNTRALAVIAPGARLPDDAAVKAAQRRRAGNPPLVASIGRLEAEKGIDLLVDAIPRVLERVPSCRFVIAGAGSVETELHARARALGVADAVAFPGEIADAPDLLARAHVYANPSPVESFGIATAEAMGYALPVVGMATGGTSELVEHRVTGLLVDGRDPDAFAAAVCELAADARFAARLGAAARTRALSRFAFDRTVEQTLRVYERLAEVRGR